MKTVRGIGMCDGVSKSGIQFSLAGILNGYKEHWYRPSISNLGHDRTKPVGFSSMDGIYLEPGKTLVPITMNIATTKEDNETLCAYMNQNLYDDFYLRNKDNVEKLKAMIGDKLSASARIAPIQAVAYYDKDIVKKIFPELQENLDKDFLIDVGELEPVLPGIFRKGDFLLFAHSFFRRNCSILNSLNSPFLERLQEIQRLKVAFANKELQSEKIGKKTKGDVKQDSGIYSLESKIFKSEIVGNINPSLSVKVAIDFNLIGLAGTEHQEFEFQYWRGPKFNDDLTSIKDGVTQYGSTEYEYAFSNVKNTDFYWYEHDSKRTFECEEIADRINIRELDTNFIGCRYTHSILNPETNLPYHLDGAIRAYTEEELIYRLDTDISKSKEKSKCKKYIKLWRIDGDIPVALWKELLYHFYRDNTMIGEYFDVPKEESPFEKKVEECVNENTNHEQTLEEYVPVNMNAEDGLRIFFKYIYGTQLPNDIDLQVESTECFKLKQLDDSETKSLLSLNTMESETITMLKFLKRKGVKVSNPNTSLVDNGETVFNFPIFVCKDFNIASKVQECFSELCLAWKNAKDDRLISYAIEINGDKNSAYLISFAGHINDFCKFFYQLGTIMPDISAVDDWLEKAYKVNNLFKKADQIPSIFRILLPCGELNFQRNFIPFSFAQIISDEKGCYFKYKATEAQFEYMKSNKITAAPHLLLEYTICKKCGNKYQECDCIKYIDKDVFEECHPMQLIGLSWTNRSVWS